MTRLANKRRLDAVIAKRQAKRLPLPWATAEPAKPKSLPVIFKATTKQTNLANNASQ